VVIAQVFPNKRDLKRKTPGAYKPAANQGLKKKKEEIHLLAIFSDQTIFFLI